MFGIVLLGMMLTDGCLIMRGDLGKAISVGVEGRGKASSAAALTRLIGGDLEPYDEFDPSKVLFKSKIYAKTNCRNIRIHTRNHVLIKIPPYSVIVTRNHFMIC